LAITHGVAFSGSVPSGSCCPTHDTPETSEPVRIRPPSSEEYPSDRRVTVWRPASGKPMVSNSRPRSIIGGHSYTPFWTTSRLRRVTGEEEPAHLTRSSVMFSPATTVGKETDT
jgi:hypothetical protein